MIVSVHQPQYIPWLGFFDKLAKSDVFVYLDKVQYKPREWQNRNKIRINGGDLWLTVPIVHTGELQTICDVRIDNSSAWAQKHWKSLCTWYAKSPFFNEYKSFFEDVYSKNWDFLIDLNIHLIEFFVVQLKISVDVHRESNIGTTSYSTDRIIELIKKLNADAYLTGIGGKNYLEEDKFDEAKITLMYQQYAHPTYKQNYVTAEDSFLPNLSILDLLFNEGPNSCNFFTKKVNDYV